MRRLCVSLVICALAAGVFPARADAYFWEWVDSLSGPRFGGLLGELRFACTPENGDKVLQTFQDALKATSQQVGARAGTVLTRTEEAFVDRGINALTAAASYASRARKGLEDSRSKKEFEDPGELFIQALEWHDYAQSQFAWANRLREMELQRVARLPTGTAQARPEIFDLQQSEAAFRGLPRPRPVRLIRQDAPEYGARTEATQIKTRMAAGASYSLCRTEPIDRGKAFFSLRGSVMWDRNEANQFDRNMMYGVSLGYHRVLTPVITVGAGAGYAWFRTAEAAGSSETTTKENWFIEPFLIDVHPLAIGQPKYSPDAWRQVLFVRFSGMIFPSGFDQDFFGGRSPEYGAELVRAYGIYINLEPIFRKKRGRW